MQNGPEETPNKRYERKLSELQNVLRGIDINIMEFTLSEVEKCRKWCKDTQERLEKAENNVKHGGKQKGSSETSHEDRTKNILDEFENSCIEERRVVLDKTDMRAIDRVELGNLFSHMPKIAKLGSKEFMNKSLSHLDNAIIRRNKFNVNNAAEYVAVKRELEEVKKDVDGAIDGRCKRIDELKARIDKVTREGEAAENYIKEEIVEANRQSG